MKVALVQMDIAWESPSKNRETAERLMLSAEKSDIYVLPEMWNTGVTTEPMGIAEEEQPLSDSPEGERKTTPYLLPRGERIEKDIDYEIFI